VINTSKIKLLVPLVLLVAAMCIAGCDSDNQGTNSDGDLDFESATEGELELSDGDVEQTEADDMEDGDFDATEKESSEDGDVETDNEIEDVETSESVDGDVEPEDEIEDIDGDLDLEDELEDLEEEIEAELEPEEEEEPVIQCSADDDPLLFMNIVDEPYFETSGYYYEGTISEKCESHGFIIAGAKGMKVTISMNPVGIKSPLFGRMNVTDIAAVSKRREHVTYYDALDSFPLSGLDFNFTLPYSGEFLVMISGKMLESTGDYSISASCSENCDTKFTRNPIVLMHGMGGFDSAFFNLVNYFQGVEENLINQGYNVHTTEVAMFNDSTYRGNEVESQLMEILETTGARKIDIIAHSQGGLDARYFISTKGHGADVAVVAMLATPHKGSIVADVLLGNVTGISQDIIVGLLDFFANLIDGSEADVRDALNFITRDHMTNVFNPQNPDDPRVKYWSWAGITCNLLTNDCNENLGHDRVGLELSITYGIIKNGDESEGYGPNDGMVQYKSAEYGEFMGYVSADHADEIGQFKSGDFDHKKFYRNVAQLQYERGF